MTPTYKAWPFKEAKSLQKRFNAQPDRPVTFETGFGPSGFPHIGTFAEVARTSWVRHAFETLTGWPTRLIAFSDDMDGLRKVPLNMPQQAMLTEHLGRPLCRIPDPFDQFESYSAHMNHRLREFLDRYGFDYQFQSSQVAYQRGDFNEGLSILLQNAEKVRAIILPTMRDERRADWSPFIPTCANCGRIYTTRVSDYHPQANTITYVCDQPIGPIDGCGHQDTISILNGNVKVGWKVDWALRWFAYEVDYEMYGKDLIDSARLSGRITRLMGKQPPTGSFYELFLDENGRKISKSIGEGLTVDTWTDYAPLESLLHYLFQNPQRAKRLFWDVVPKSVDEYLEELRRYPTVEAAKQPELAVWHIFEQGQAVPEYDTGINFSLINNLVSALGTDDVPLTLQYLEQYDPKAKAYRDFLANLVQKSSHYYRDFILPQKQFRPPTAEEAVWLRQLREKAAAYEGSDESELQAMPFDLAREFDVKPNAIFQAFYQVLLGQERGPRFGTFARLLGKERLLALFDSVLETV